MSVTAMGMALEATGISPRAKVILIAISNCANEYTFEGFPGRKDLARIADCSLDTVDRCIRELVDTGLLNKTERERESGPGLTSNLYRVFPEHDPSRKNAATPPSRENAEGGERKTAERGNADLRPPWPQAPAATLAAKGAATGTVTEPLEIISSLSVPATKAQIEALIEYAGDGVDPTAPGVHHGSDLNRFQRAGCTVDDILAAVDRLSASFRRRGKRFGTWSLLEEHVIENRDRRLAGLPPPQAAKPTAPARQGRADSAAVIARVAAEMGVK